MGDEMGLKKKKPMMVRGAMGDDGSLLSFDQEKQLLLLPFSERSKSKMEEDLDTLKP